MKFFGQGFLFLTGGVFFNKGVGSGGVVNFLGGAFNTDVGCLRQVVLLMYAVDLGGSSGSDTQRKRSGGTPNPIRGDGGTVGRGWLGNLILDRA